MSLTATSVDNKAAITLPADKECDIDLIFPNGKVIQLQYRLHSPSIDVCMEEELQVTCWKGDDMDEAEAVSSDLPHIRISKQLCIDFPPDWLDDDIQEEEEPDFDIWKSLNWMDRSQIIAILEDHGFACYDTESDTELRQALFENIDDGTIELPEMYRQPKS